MMPEYWASLYEVSFVCLSSGRCSHMNGLSQDCGNSIAYALELAQNDLMMSHWNVLMESKKILQ